MHNPQNIKSISYLKNNAAKISDDLEANGQPFFITQNGQASMVIESVNQYYEKEELMALLKIIALGEKDRLANKGFSIEVSRRMLADERKNKP
jgi:PHD/YefM family antitoxin component YafN of YafNO toxin-antitoxin module